MSFVDLLNRSRSVVFVTAGSKASLYDNAASRSSLIELRNVIVLHNFPINADAAAVPPRSEHPELPLGK